MTYVKAVFDLFRETVEHWSRDKGPLLSAAIAYYTILSLAPLLVITVAIAGLIFGEAAVEGQLVGQIEQYVGSDVAITIERIIENAASVRGSGILATVVGFLLLFIGASSVINQLKAALNMIWGISLRPKRGVVAVIKERFLSFIVVLGIGFLLVVSVGLNIVLTTIPRYLPVFSPLLVESLPRLDIVVTLVVITISFGIMFRVLPDAEVAWRDVWLGAAVTGLLFALGEYLISIYLAYSSVGSAYGAAGSLVVVLTWFYYSAIILMFGAEFTRVFANKYGSKIRPTNNALYITLREPEPFDQGQEPVPQPVMDVDDADLTSPASQSLRPIAAALIGMAFGLLLAFLSSLRRRQ